VHEGVLRHAAFREGRYLDVHRMAILADEWRARSGGARSGGARSGETPASGSPA
jgi:hypothetical protein